MSLGGLYGSGMHRFVLDEMELGLRVASWLDEEWAEGGMGWLLDLQYAQYLAEQATTL